MQWKCFLALVPAAALVFLDQTIMPVALPTIQHELGASATQLQWCVNAYLLAIAVLVLASGKISDLIGDRNSLSIGMAGFAFFSAICGMSPNIWVLIIARGLQGLSAAMMFPAQTSLIAHIFPQSSRGQATGMIVSIGSLFMILGPLIGGFLTETLSWRWIFWINLPVAAFGLWMIALLLPAPKPQPGKIDLQGFLYFLIGATSITLFFMQANEWGWTSTPSLICLTLSPIAFSLLMLREKKTSHPFLDLKLYRRPVFAAININVSIVQFILMVTVFQTIYYQEILAFTPGQTGLIISCSSFPVLFMAPIAGLLADKLTPKWPISIGYILIMTSFLTLGTFSTPSLPCLLFALVAFGMGIPLIFTPSYSTAISSVPPEKRGIAMGMLITLRFLGGTVGLALIHLFVSTVQYLKASAGPRLAEIASFSAIHYTLAALLTIAFLFTFHLHHRKAKLQLFDTI